MKYVKLCGYKNGEIGNGRKKECQNGIPKLTLDEIASQLGTSKRDPQRALSIERNLTDSMKELLDTGVITKTLAADTIASASCSKIVTNIRQRDIGNPNPMKLGRCIKELERIYRIKNGGSGFYGNQYCKNEELGNNFVAPKTQEDLAKELGITVQSINNYKKLTEMIPELEELVDTGIATPTTAFVIILQNVNKILTMYIKCNNANI